VLLVLLAALAVFIVGLTSTSAQSSVNRAPCGFRSGPPPAYRHVITLVFENRSFPDVAHASPYLNKLAAACGLADNYWAITHPSLPNYIAMTSGHTGGMTDNCTTCSVSSPSIFDQVGSSHWRGYQESMPRTGFTGAEAPYYAKKHNPAAYYTNLADAYARNAVPLGTLSGGALISDLDENLLPDYSFVTPGLCNDEHDCDVIVGDLWLARWIPRILESEAYAEGDTALFITYDEGTYNNHVYTVVVSPYTRPGTVSHIRYTHYSLLKTQESLLGLPCLAHACDYKTASMRDAFGL
jgi:phospholipase C